MQFPRIAAAFLVAAFSCVPALARAQAQPPGPGSAVSALKYSTRSNSGPVTASGLLLTPYAVGQVENCSTEGTLSPSTLRFGILINFPRDAPSCNMRRDAQKMADLSVVAMAQKRDDLAGALLDAAVVRLCEGKGNRKALGDLCPVKQ